MNEFNFDTYMSPKERIKYNTKKFADVTVQEAFALSAKTKSEANKIRLAPAIEYDGPFYVNVGDTIRVKTRVNGKTLSVYSNNPKEQFACRHSVVGWNIDPDTYVDALVVEKKNNVYYIDIIENMKDEWRTRMERTMFNKFQSAEVIVEDLQLVRGGYTGKIKLKDITKSTGKVTEVNAFIPGSMITLNIERDFDQWIGKSVEAMVVNFTEIRGELSVTCSRKKLINAEGKKILINLYDTFYSQGEKFNQVFDAEVTGIINSNNKKGIFAELINCGITGLIEMDPNDLVNYRIGDEIKVEIDDVEYDTNKEPYRRNRDGIIYECTLRPILKEIK